MPHVVLVIPRSGRPRAVGPFLTEATAARWLEGHADPGADHLVQPLEEPFKYQYGRHSLVPSPVPRDLAAGGRPIDQWQTGDAQGKTAHFKGMLARCNVASSDGRVLVMDGDNALTHFTAVPVPVLAVSPQGSLAIIGVVERVHADHSAIYGEGRISLTALQANLPDLARQVLIPNTEMAAVPLIPCSVGVGHGVANDHDGRTYVTGDWFLREVAVGTEAVWAGVGLQLTEIEYR